MKTILVSGASGIVGYGCLKSLRYSKEKYRLIGTTIYDNSVAPKFCDIFVKAPNTSDSGYMDWLTNTIEKYSVDLIIPCIEVDMYKWAANIENLNNIKCKILLNNIELVDLCGDKWKFYTVLQKEAEELAIPSAINGDFTQLTKKFKLPFLLKPRKGFASKGILIITKEKEFVDNMEAYGDTMLAQPIIGDMEEEYTVSAFFDKYSELCAYISLKRKLSKLGFTEEAQTVTINGIEGILKKLARIFKPIGPTNFQFRKQGAHYKLLEINPRISSATSIRTAFGYNESIMSTNYYLHDILPKQPIIRNGTAIRYVEDFVIYDRDYL